MKSTENINVINAVALSCMIIIIALMTRNNKINRYIGIRTTRTMSSDKIWKKINAFASNLLLAVGGIGLILAVFLSNMSVVIIIVLLLMAVVGSIVYSYYVK